MNRVTTTLTLTTVIAILAIASASAATNFEGVGGATSGSSQLKAGSGAVLNVGGFPLVSSKAPDTWRIQDSKSEQRVTKKGPHLDQTVNFENPVIVTPQGLIPVAIDNPIIYQYVIQPDGTLHVALSKTTEIKISTSEATKCTVTIPATAANKQLTKVTEIVSASSLEVNSEISHITFTVEPAAVCAGLSIFAGTTGELKQSTIEHGVTQV